MNAALGYVSAYAEELGDDPAFIVLAGDSAGSQLAAQVSILTTDSGYAVKVGIAPTLKPDQLAAAIPVSGAYDLDNIDLKGNSGWFLRTILWAYSGARNFMSDPRFGLLSVTQYVSATFPPAFITSGNGDPLAPPARQFAATLQGLGVHILPLFFPDDYNPALPHEYQFNLDTAAGAEAQVRMLAFLRETAAARKQIKP